MGDIESNIVEDENIIDLRDIWEALKKGWKVILICTILGTLVSAGISYFVLKPIYQSDTKLFIGKESSGSENTDYNYSDVQMYKNMIKTYSEVIKTKDLVDGAIKKSGINETVGNVMNSLTVDSITDTQIIEIKYRSENPEESVIILKAIEDEFIETAKGLVANGNIQVIEEPDFPQKPVSPNKKKNIAMGFAAGFVIGVGMVLIMELMDNTYKNKEQIEKDLKIPVIGVIPNLKES